MARTNPIALQKALKGADYPASRETLVKLAEKNQADRTVVDDLRAIPEKKYSGPDAVSHVIFGSG